MTRWEPNAPGRLERAAMELYGERGFDQTTVAQIAQRAGLTERTFYRHFTDKREVIFSGEVERVLRGALADPPSARLAADAGVAVFRAAFERWVDAAERHDFGELVREALDELRAVIGA